jgi:DNA-binding helix-hairpin-helix protein with protein kinase domain
MRGAATLVSARGASTLLSVRGAATLVTARGRPLRLAAELGRGGEGAVYAIAGERGRVAKVYHRAPDARKQAKLAFMATHAEPALLDYSAWPQETLHAAPGGPAVGFLMESVASRAAIHAIYSPAQRREEHPGRAWDFLLFVARNTAAAFAALHAHGHVLGDVNQGNVIVGGDSRVVLIDCDSFQVNASGTVHICDVGVGHFTPPELQGIASFDAVVRTPNHDNFGLAVLLFHLLLGGRHPYCGVPLVGGAGEALEDDIRALRYAHARDAARRGLRAPPRAPSPAMLPARLASMFEAAFTETGARAVRPTARQWVDALDALRGELQRCARNRMHVHPAHVAACPWCALERDGVVHFIDPRAPQSRIDAVAFITETWARIDAVPPPPPVVMPCVAARALSAPPKSRDTAGARRLRAYRAVVIAGLVLLLAWAPQAWGFALLAAALAWSLAESFADAPRLRERARLRGALQRARQEAQALVDAAAREAGPVRFQAEKTRLARVREQYLAFARDARRSPRLRLRHAARRVAMEAALRNGASLLQGCRREAASRLAHHRSALDAAARRIAEAERDLAALG